MTEPRPQGTMIVVVGPSGAGKDTLMDYARKRLGAETEIGFVQRFITRASEAGGEDHRAVTVAEFEKLRDQGAFAVSWGAHGLFYGIPANTQARIGLGDTLVVNGSRAAIADILHAYPNVLVISVTARPEIIAARLAARGRETEQQIRDRLSRTTDNWRAGCECIEIDNSGPIEEAGAALLTVIRGVANGNKRAAADA